MSRLRYRSRMTWHQRTAPIQIGDEIAYSAAFLKNTGQHTEDTPFARGTVTGFVSLEKPRLQKLTGTALTNRTESIWKILRALG